jgi:predicted phosphodiesterase
MRLSRWIIACLLLMALPPAGAQPPETFRFLHITDTHVTASGKNADAVRQLVAEIGAMNLRPAFVVHTGDVTELGTPEEFDRYRAAIKDSPVPFYAAPGNHDVRWSPLGKEAFTQALGPRYRSFDYGGCHFALLDSTVLLEHWGHFDAAMLKWLEGDLKKVKKGAPVFLFFHHGIGLESRQVDNEDDLLRVIAPYNVAAILVGHGHSDLQWKINGVPCVMARGLYQGSYHLVEVGPEEIKILRVRKEDADPRAGGGPQVIWTIPRAAKPFRRVAFAWDDPNLPLLARRRPLAELRVDNKGAHDDRVKAAYRVDNGEIKPMERDVRDKESVSFMTQFETKGMGNGAHRLTLLLTAPGGEVFRREETFVVEQLEGQPKRAWVGPTGDTIQSSPALAEGTLYVTSFDGKLYAFNSDNGKPRWTAAAKGPLYATPLVADGAVYVGSMDHFFYAFDAKTGRTRWKYDTGAPIFGTAAFWNGVVCVGGNRKIYGLDAATGKEVWTQPAGGFFQARAAAADGVFYLGGWDNTLYALDAATGTPRWAAKMGRSNGGRGNLSFYFSPAIASPTVAEGRVYVCTNDGLLHAVNVKTGEDDWIARAPKGGDVFGYSSPLYAEGKIYLGGLGEAGQGDCYALDAKTGAPLWRCSTGADNYDSSPALAGDMLVIGSVQGKLSWIDRATGKLRWQYALDPGYLFSTPAADGKRVYVTSMNTTVTALTMP